MKIDDLKQEAAYCNKIGTCANFAGKMIVGVLIDSKNYQLAFTPYMDAKQQSLPLVCVSLPIMWRNEDLHPLSINSAAIMLLSLLHLLNVDRIISSQISKPVMVAAKKLYKKPYVPLPFPATSVVELSVKDMINKLEEKNKQLEEKDREMERKLEEKVRPRNGEKF